VPTAEDRALAFGHFIDTPVASKAMNEALVLAEKLRLRYGIDTGHPQADRLAAARRAQVELLERLSFGPAEIREAARELGYSLDPALCANACANVEALAVLQLKRRALLAFADGRPVPGTLSP
jgi:hypothetical protein